MEIERKFLVDALPDGLGSTPSSLLRQGYIITDPTAEVRLRDEDGTYSLNVKQGTGIERAEHESGISGDQFDAFWPATKGRRVEKRRHRIALGPHTIELDVFEGALAGLVIAEVEFPSMEDARSFEPPDWFGREVTDVGAFRNAWLALHGIPGDVDAGQSYS